MSKLTSRVLNTNPKASLWLIADGDSVLTLEQKIAQRQFKEIERVRKEDERGEFVILNLICLQEKLAEVSYLELGYALLLLPYISFFDKDKRKQGRFTRIGTEAKPITYNKLEEIWGLQPDSVRKLVKKLVDKRILVIQIDADDKRKKLVHFSKRLVVKGEKPKIYKMYTRVYQNSTEEAIKLIRYKKDAAKAMAMFNTLLIKMNQHSQLLLEDEAKADVPKQDEKIQDFFNRIKVASKNATTISSIKTLLGVTDNRSINSSLSLLQNIGMLNQVSLNQKKVYMINPVCASKQDSGKFELYAFTLKYFFETAKVSQIVFYQTLTSEEVELLVENQLSMDGY